MARRTRAQWIILVIAALGTALSIYWGVATFFNDPGVCRSVDVLNNYTLWHDGSWEEHFLSGVPGTRVEHATDYLEAFTNFGRGMLRTLAVVIGYGAIRRLKLQART